MEIAIALLIIGVLFVSSRAELSEANLPINEEYGDKRSANAISSSAVSEIKINWEYSPDRGYEVTCGATVQNLSYSWTAQNGTLRNNEVAKGNLLSINPVTKENDRIFCCQASNTAENLTKCERLHPLIVSSDALERIIDSSAEMYCEVFGIDGHVDIKWERAEGLPLPKNAIVNDGLLEIPKLARTDTGNYSCVGFVDGKIAFYQKIPLKVVSPLEIVELRTTGLDGRNENNVTIQCLTQLDEPITYKWKAHTEGRKDLQENEKTEGDSLFIYDFKKDNEGTFCCVATNTLLTREKCLTIKRPILGMYHVVTLGSSVNLECHEFATDSNMEIDWAREDGRQFAPNIIKLSNGSLALKDITIEDGGRYKCTATKRGGLSASVTKIIEVVMIPVISIIPEIGGNITAKLGEKINLTCNTDGYPQPSVLWQKLSPDTELYRIGELGTRGSAVYEIEFLSGNEAGIYICLAENSAGSSNKTVRVIIEWPVLEVHPTVSHTIIAGRSVALECRESAGYSDMKFTWSREDECSFAANVHQLDNGSLTITDIAISQEGRYKCSASNGLASASVTTEIEVRTLPVIKIPEIPDGNITKKLGDEVELTCEAEGHPEPNVQWQKFSNESNSYQIVKPTAPEFAVHTITLLTNEAGLYRCLATNPAGSSNKTVRVVIQKPVLEVHPKDPHIVIAGNSITLECRETAGYSNMTFTWAREDDSSFAANVHQSDNGSLTITDIAISQEGRYKCSASNGLASVSVTTEIEVRTLPVIKISGITDGYITKKLGNKVELTCEAKGHPDPNVQWLKSSYDSKSYVIVKPAVPKSAVLEIILSPNEVGLYVCLATNLAGSSNRTVKIAIGTEAETHITELKILGAAAATYVMFWVFEVGYEALDVLESEGSEPSAPDEEESPGEESPEDTSEEKDENFDLEVYPKGRHVVIAGNSITLVCRESAGNSKMLFTWSRANNIFHILNICLSTDCILTITNITISQEGRYKCSAHKGRVSASVETEIEVTTFPVIRIPEITDRNITKNLGDKVELICEAEGHPEPTVQWQKFSNESHSYQTVLRSTTKSAVHDITSLTTSEAGLYRCLTENSAGYTNKTVQVVIQHPVLKVHPEDPHTVLAGNAITLECREMAGYPNMTFTWSREDECSFASNVHQFDNGTLTIRDISLYQEGRFNCSASNGLASASITTEIEVRTLPDIIIRESTDGYITKKLGDKLQLTCEAEGHPEPSVQWQKFSNESHSYQTVLRSTTTSAAYKITSLSTSEAGPYLCLAENLVGASNETVRVVIKQPVLEVYPKDPHIVIAGNSITLECRETEGYPNMTFTWSREDECSFASNVHQFDNGTLTIRDISLYQEGRFNCSASNGLASASITTEIEVRTLPDIIIRESTDGYITKKLGDKLQLTCEAEGHPEPSVQWQKFSNESHSYQTVLRSTTTSAAYKITSLSTSEAGPYLCLAENLVGASNETVRVVIKQPVLEVYPKDPHIVIAGNSITLECRETEGYPNMTFTWSREDECSFASNVHQFDNGTLTIRDISLYQEGRFNCSASNGLASASITTEIEVRTLPDIIIRESTDGYITKKLGDKLQLTCEAEGHPEPSVQWQKFSNESHSYQTVLRSTTTSAAYKITSLSTSEAGPYLCLAENLVGASNETVRVVIKQPVLEVYPKDPHIVIAGNSITLECRETEGYSNMTFTWARDDECSFASNVHQSDNGTLTITDISSYQGGRFNCSASNGLASASVTTEIEVRTLPDINIRESTDGYITKKLGDKLQLTCEAEGHPEPSVQWQKFSNESHSYQTVLRSTTTSAAYKITSLSTSEAGPYLCLAVNLAGSSNETVQVVIKPPVLEVYPKDPHVVIAGNSITLECRETAGYSNMTFTWARNDECSFASNVHQSDNGTLTITDISSYQEGRFTCSASNGLASTSVTTEIEVRTLPDINIPEITHENITRKLGDKVELICEAEGHPEPNVQWQKSSPGTESFQAIKSATLNSAVHEIASLLISEAGLYLCSAVNPAGSSNKTVRVVIKQPFLEVYPKDRHVVIAGNSITLECRESAGYPNMKFIWSREDECSFAPNVHQSDNDSLTITDIAVYQGGRFICSGSNGLASTSVTTEIEVRTLPDINIPEITHENITRKLGDKVELICEAEGHPEPNVQWQKSSPGTESFQAIKSATLNFAVHEIASLSTSEAGLYLCSAVNPAGSSNKTVRVMIKQPILGIYLNHPHVVIAGRSITLECYASAGYSDMKFTWSRENIRELPPNAHQSENGFLTITNITPNEEGRYKCSATNGLKSASASAYIAVDSPISNMMMTIEFLSSSFATFTCQAFGGKASWNWFSKNGNLLENEVVWANKLAIDMTSPKVKKDRIYCCEGFNTAGKLTKCQQFPRIILYSKSISGHIGDSIELRCTPIGIEASNLHIKWERMNGSPLSKNAVAFDDRLKIPALAKTDFGSYTCVGNYTFDGKSWTFSRRLDLKASVTTEIEAEGHPEPTVQWQKFSHESYSYQAVLRSTTESAVHEITSLSTSKAGLYLYLAVNQAGSSHKAVRVVITQPVFEVYPNHPEVVIAGNSITLECYESAGYSDMKLTWSRENIRTLPSNAYQSENGFLTITNITPNEEGRYKCSATNGLASASASAYIAVDSPISNITMTIEFLSSFFATFTCQAIGGKASWNWFSKNGNLLENEVVRENKLDIDMTSPKVKKDRIYCCEGFNTAGKLTKCQQFPPMILSAKSISGHIGESIELGCTLIGIEASNLHIKWERMDGSPLSKNAVAFDDRLKIPTLDETDFGPYTCVGNYMLDGKLRTFSPTIYLRKKL